MHMYFVINKWSKITFIENFNCFGNHVYQWKKYAYEKPRKERSGECFRVMATISSEAKIGHWFLNKKNWCSEVL